MTWQQKLTWILVILFIIFAPITAGHLFHTIVSGLGTFWSSLGFH